MTPDNAVTAESVAVDPPPSIIEVETHGDDTIPDADRTSSWLDLHRIQFG
ncbi:MAG: hypothetical protein H7201_17160, partial [Candidatus Saccharibacteria bacterium]|nr:hypothetical protein [Microbacteriaceae bacterium]